MSERILIVEDDQAILRGLEMNLSVEGYDVGTAADGDEGLDRALREPWDLLVLDVMLPGVDGLEILRRLRQEGRDAAVILLTARGQETDKVAGLNLGADDYITKPFALAELLARARAVLRRRAPSVAGTVPRGEDAGAEETLRFGAIALDLDRRRVTRDDEEVALTAREFDVLAYFARRPDRVVTREELLGAVWGRDYLGSTRTVDNFVAQLRSKLEAEPDRPAHLVTVRGVGYRFLPEPPSRG